MNAVFADTGYWIALITPDDELKEWSITDCSSFLVMEHLNIWEALANDHHFVQAGFFILLT